MKHLLSRYLVSKTFWLVSDTLVLKSVLITYLHLTKVVSFHPIFWKLVRIIKARHQQILVLYKGRTLAETIRVILFPKHAYYLNKRSPNKSTLDSKVTFLAKD